MARYENTLTTLEQVKQLGKFTDDTEDALLKRLIRSASAQIEGACLRVFVPYKSTLAADTPLWDMLLLPDDLLELTELTVYGQEMTPDQYVLLDYNQWPKYAVVPTNTNTFLLWQNTSFQSIRITGTWGYNTNPEGMFSLTGVTLTANATASATTLSVSGLTDIETFSYIKIGDELIQVLAVIDNDPTFTLTVKRGVNGYTAEAHTSGDAIYLYDIPQEIAYAVTDYVFYLYQVRDNFGERVQTGNGTVMISKALPDWLQASISDLIRVRFYTPGESLS